jgi:hypothetical protein
MVHHRTHNSPPPVPVLSQSNLIHNPQAILAMIHSDSIFPPTPWSSEWSLSFGLSYQNLVHFSFLSYACHISCPPHSPWLCLGPYGITFKCVCCYNRLHSDAVKGFWALWDNIYECMCCLLCCHGSALRDFEADRIIFMNMWSCYFRISCHSWWTICY